MIVFPLEYVPIKYPGYYWNTKTEKLYSIKVHGELKELKEYGEFYDRKRGIYYPPGYNVSHEGRPRRIPLTYLQTLTDTDTDTTHVIGKYNEKRVSTSDRHAGRCTQEKTL